MKGFKRTNYCGEIKENMMIKLTATNFIVSM